MKKTILTILFLFTIILTMPSCPDSDNGNDGNDADGGDGGGAEETVIFEDSFSTGDDLGAANWWEFYGDFIINNQKAEVKEFNPWFVTALALTPPPDSSTILPLDIRVEVKVKLGSARIFFLASRTYFEDYVTYAGDSYVLTIAEDETSPVWYLAILKSSSNMPLSPESSEAQITGFDPNTEYLVRFNVTGSSPANLIGTINSLDGEEIFSITATDNNPITRSDHVGIQFFTDAEDVGSPSPTFDDFKIYGLTNKQ